MNTMNKRNEPKTIFRKLAFLMNESVWQLALVGVVVAALVDGVLSIGTGTIA